MTTGAAVLTWLHVGDLHLTQAGEPNHKDFDQIAALASALPSGAIDFVLLPGDNADDGTAEQYEIIRAVLAGLSPPVHILPGDHDVATGSLDPFHRVLRARALPYAMMMRGHRCLFLDVVSAGQGGLDFRLGRSQLDWCARELSAAAASGEIAVVFMHTYPADLREGAAELSALLAANDVACVDMGHTHYNELSNDGHTIFMATRSTGQVEEGPSGFSVAASDGGRISWRFRDCRDTWPMVLVTCPVDRRLSTASARAHEGRIEVRAKVLSDAPVVAVEASVDGLDWMPMVRADHTECFWAASFDHAAEIVRVRALDQHGRVDEDRVVVAPQGYRPPTRFADGSDRDAIGVWLEKGILGTQLGPNRNGRKW